MFGKIEGDIENAVTGDRDELKDALFEDLRGLKGFVTMLGEISEIQCPRVHKTGEPARQKKTEHIEYVSSAKALLGTVTVVIHQTLYTLSLPHAFLISDSLCNAEASRHESGKCIYSCSAASSARGIG